MSLEMLTASGTLVVTECPACFVVYAITKRMHDDRLADGGDVYCPNGHAWVFAEPETARLRKRLRAAEQSRDAARAREVHERDQRQAAQRSAAAYRGQVNRLRNRAAAGVCPVPGCRRHFANLARHMAGQHPGFRDQDPPA